MSSTTTTQFYGLTQYIGTDKPDFSDNNQAFRNVDADLHQVVQDSRGFTSDIADLNERVGNLDTDLTNLSGDLDGEKAKIVALQNKELSQDTEISRVERNAQDMITAYNEASATSTHAYAVGDYFIYNNVLYQATAAIAVGATIVPDTNCTTTNVTSELIQLNSALDDMANPRYEGDLTNFLIIGTQLRGVGLIAEIPTSMNITVTSARIFGDDSAWHDLVSPYITNDFGKKLNFGDTYITAGYVTQGLSYAIEITGTSASN